MLREFRDRLIAHGLEQQVLDAILAQCSKRGLLRAGGRARTDSTHVIACIRDLNRLEFVTETMRCPVRPRRVGKARVESRQGRHVRPLLWRLHRLTLHLPQRWRLEHDFANLWTATGQRMVA
ncbi:hypothetical protein ACFXDF_39625 [Streptomyces sp. NPDC059426]|uniref:hypothetical protein n=1 Tax=Streptomyces sp. NPDC059426 TaxID=3346827 RepID=UPI00367DF0A2